MIRGLYTSASAMLAEMTKQNAVATDLDNLKTPGYRSEEVTISAFPQMLISRLDSAGTVGIGSMGTGVAVSGLRYRQGTGSLENTGRSLDVAITDPGVYFAANTPAGVRYLRRGDFRLDAAGDLLTQEGYSVLGVNGQPLRPGSGATIAANGQVSGSGGTVGQLALYSFSDPGAMAKDQEGYFAVTAASGAPVATQADLRPGFLEGSNVDLAKTMVRSIEAFRAYEENSQAVTTENSTLDLAVNQVGKVG